MKIVIDVDETTYHILSEVAYLCDTSTAKVVEKLISDSLVST